MGYCRYCRVAKPTLPILRRYNGPSAHLNAQARSSQPQTRGNRRTCAFNHYFPPTLGRVGSIRIGTSAVARSRKSKEHRHDDLPIAANHCPVVAKRAKRIYEIVAPTIAPPIAPTKSPSSHMGGFLEQSTIRCLRIDANNLAISAKDLGFPIWADDFRRALRARVSCGPQSVTLGRPGTYKELSFGFKFAENADSASLDDLSSQRLQMEAVFMRNFGAARSFWLKWNVLMFLSTVVAVGVLLGGMLAHLFSVR